MKDTPGLGRLGSVYGALVLVQVFFGLHYPAAKVVLLEIPPAAWALIRVAGGSVLLLAAARLSGRRFPTSSSTLGRLALFSVFGVVINQLCFVEGLSRTSAIHSSVLVTTIPVGTLLFAVLLRRETLDLRKLASIGVAFAGVLLVVQPAAGDMAGISLEGDLLILLNALSYALFLVLSKRVLWHTDPLAATAVLMGFGTLGMLVPGLPALLRFDPLAVSWQTWGLGLFIVIFPTAAAYLMIYWALARVESSLVAFFIYLQPLIATVLATLFFGEIVTPSTLVGALLLFAAVYLALSGSRIRASRASSSAPRGSTDSSISKRAEW